MNKVLTFLLLVLLLHSQSKAQNIVLSGNITDTKSGESLPYATIKIPEFDLITTANQYGFYSLSIKNKKIPDSLTVMASYIGYKSAQLAFYPNKNKMDYTLNISLVQGIELGDVDVYSNAIINTDKPISQLEISTANLQKLPKFIGEADIVKSYQFLPGVLPTTEGASGIVVRGGSPDQNQFIVDDISIYYLSHYQGIVSVFDIDAISSSRLIKGGFPAKYGGRLSSVFDIHLKEGDLNKFHFKFSLSPISSKLSVEGPIQKNKSSYFVSLRRSNFDLLMRLASKMASENTVSTYTFYDLYFKLNRILKHNNRIFLSAYYGDDILNLKSEVRPTQGGYANNLLKTVWDNKFGTAFMNLRYYQAINSRLFFSSQIGAMKYRFYNASFYSQSSSDTILSAYSDEFSTGIYEISGNTHFDFNINQHHSLNFGVSTNQRFFNPGIFSQERTGSRVKESKINITQNEITTSESFAYVEDVWKISPKLKFSVGAHLSLFHTDTTYFHSIEPRISGNYYVNDRNEFSATYTMMTQYMHLLSSSNISMAFDMWLPANSHLIPETSQQYSISYKHSFPKWKAYFTIESYYKKSENLIDFKENESFSYGSTNWKNRLENDGVGTNKGLEFLFSKESDKLSIWLSYTLSQSLRQFSNLNNGKVFNYKYDRPNAITLAGVYTFNEKYSISANWIYYSGNLTTIADSKFQSIDEPQYSYFFGTIFNTAYNYSTRNNYRLPAYHRLDIGFNIKKIKPKGIVNWNFGAYNVYNRKNPYTYYYNENSKGELKLYKLTLFPIIPSISYQYEF
jgi:hypothetical protein